MDERKRPRKLLIASVGVASVMYAACSNGPFGYTSGNLVAPPEMDTGTRDAEQEVSFDVAGDTAAEPRVDSGSDAPSDSTDSMDSMDSTAADGSEDSRDDG